MLERPDAGDAGNAGDAGEVCEDADAGNAEEGLENKSAIYPTHSAAGLIN